MFGHLKDLCHVQEGALLHWFFPGKDLFNELGFLVDDESCIEMADSIMDEPDVNCFLEQTLMTLR